VSNPPPPSAQLTGAAYLRLILLGAGIGVPAALLAAVFLALVHEIEHWLWDELPASLGATSPPWYLVLGLPVVGAAIVAAARALLPGDGGHEPMAGLGGPPTPVRHVPGVALAALGSLAFGAVLGPEAPLIALGSAVGLAAAPLLRLGTQGQAVIGTAGSFSAVSALFGGPLVAGMLLLEGGVAMGAAVLPVLLPGVVAAGVGYVLFVGLGDWGGLSSTPLMVPGLPAYDGTHILDLGIGVVVGVVAALLVHAVRRLATLLADQGSRRVAMPALLLAGGAATGGLAILAQALGADSQDVLFSGQAAIPDLVSQTSAGVVAVLLVTKAIGYAVCLGCGFRGGPVFPAVFLGIALAEFAVIAFDVSPTLAVAVGAAAGMAAGTRLIFSSLLFAVLLVGREGLDTMPAAVFATAAAWVVAQALDRRREPEPVAAA
jgi:H+/Cl- antiporter ClcA